jgi:hypothetical protein
MKTILALLFVMVSWQVQAQCTGDCQNGNGKKSDADGNTYNGQWKNGMMDGIGTLSTKGGIRYYGEFKADNMHGYGVIYGADGKVIQSGIYETNKLSSSLSESSVLDYIRQKQSGTLTASSTDCIGDCQNGNGKKADADGSTYDGHWSNGMMDGIGTLSTKGGIRYYGEFKADNMHGYGVIYGADGKVIQSGIYDTNKLSSSLSESSVLDYIRQKQSGSVSTNNTGCSGDCQNGKGRKADTDGNVYDGQWKSGMMDGLGTLTTSDGIKYYGEFKTDNMHGHGIIYGKDGKVIQSGIYENNTLKTSKSESEVLLILSRYK